LSGNKTRSGIAVEVDSIGRSGSSFSVCNPLSLLKVPQETATVARANPEQNVVAYLKISPSGLVPALKRT